MHGPKSGFTVLSFLFSLALFAVPLGLADGGGAPDSNWLATTQQAIAAEEYHITWQTETYLLDVPAAWQAPNRAHGFRTYFTEAGPRVISRNEAEPSWQWALELLGAGRGAELRPVRAPRLEVSDSRIDYDRGSVTEWYDNGPRGLKQGFVLWERPETLGGRAVEVTPPQGPRAVAVAPSQRESLAFLEIGLTGTLEPAFSTDGQAIDFRTGRGVNLVHFAGLRATDASGKELPSWMEGFTHDGIRGVRIVLDDADAAYPVTIDPLATSPAWTAESDQDSAYFGTSVSTAGDVNGDGYSDVIVGAYRYDNGQTDEGRAFVYLGSATGPDPSAAWTAESNQAYARFAYSVSTAGDVNGDGYSDVAIGAYFYDNGQTNEGRAFVYHGSATGLGHKPAWTAEGNQDTAYFGVSVSTAGDTNHDGYSDVIVGASLYDNGQTNEGRAFVYHGSAAGLASSPSWSADGDQDSAYFGKSVSVAGDVDGDGYSDVIIGADYYDHGQTNEGRVFVYRGSATGLGHNPTWTAESDQDDAYFGFSVSTAGDVNGDGYSDVIVGARYYDHGQPNEGSAFLYHGSAAGLSSKPAWTAESDQQDARFSFSVSTAGDVNGDGYADVIVGARYYDNGETDEGRAFLYHGSASGLAASPAWTAESNQDHAYMGYSVSTAGDVNGDGYSDVIVGANGYDHGQMDEGRAFVYLGAAAGLSSHSAWTAESDQQGADFGLSVSTAGDVNGDGYADVIVGAHEYDNGQANEGRAFLYRGSASGIEASPSWIAESDQEGADFGGSVSTAGDVNGDGYADVIVGARYYHNGESNEGRAFLYCGSAAGVDSSPAWTAESDQVTALFGNDVSTAGDVNGDGYSDVIIGSYRYDTVDIDEGRAYVYHGSPAGLEGDPAWIAAGDRKGATFGISVSTAGDVNGDGYADVIVGESRYHDGQANEGRALVYHGSVVGLDSEPAWTAESDQEYAYFGNSVSTAGDVNGDGYADIIVGAHGYDNGPTSEGRVLVYHGSAAGVDFNAAWIAEGNMEDAGFGRSVSTAGDVNGDGYADVVIGASFYENGQVDEGGAFVYHGSAAGLGGDPAWTAEGDQELAYFGTSVATAGDVNGDGFAEVIVGARHYDGGQEGEGRAFVYYGNEGPGLSLRPEQRRADDTRLIGRLGHTRTTDGFRLAAIGRSPFGRARVKLQWEAKAAGQPLDGTSAQSSGSWHDTGTRGVGLNEPVSGQEPGRYHWRVRLLYDLSSSPFLSASRWFTIPWGGQEETDLLHTSIIGGFVWLDADRDGIRQPEEERLASITVQLLDTGGAVVDQTPTDNSGRYQFFVADSNASYRVKFLLPAGYQFTLQDQGPDDTLDSDAHPVTGESDVVTPPYESFDSSGWSAGMYQEGPCPVPDEEVYIYTATLDENGNNVLHFQDPNQADRVTGYNVYRSSDASPPRDEWPLVASDVTDMDAAEPNIQWVDSSGDVSPSGVWYYDVAAYNNLCDGEGP